MKSTKILTILLVFICCLSTTPMVLAQNDGQPSAEDSQGATGSDELMKGLMGLLQQGIDEFIGNYKGRLGDVTLIERFGNKIVLEVTYDNVKRSDNVYVQGEVRHFGEKLEGFKNTLTSVSGSHGKVRLSIGKTPAQDDGWDSAASETLSDQIRLYLVRDTNPDRPFGEIIYDLPKVWTDSGDPDEEATAPESESIELAEGETPEDENASPSPPSTAPPVFVKPGMVLKPRTPAAAGATASAAQPAGTQSLAKQIPAARVILKDYDFYRNARYAKWHSGAGSLPFPGRANDARGFARQIPKAALSTGNAALSLLQTHPQWINRGWIQGRYPLMVLKQNMRFKAVVGFLKGTVRSDGAVFQVHIKEGGKTYRAVSRTLKANRYAGLDVDLSRWTGKKIQIILQVISGKNSEQDWAVWVKPRLAQ